MKSTRATNNYMNAFPMPTVYGMMTPGGAEYSGTSVHSPEGSVFPKFPPSWMARCQTPVPRMTAFFGGSFQLNALDPRATDA